MCLTIFVIGKARDMFRSSGGLSYMCNLLFSTSSSSIKQAAMYTLGCAVEKNGNFTHNRVVSIHSTKKYLLVLFIILHNVADTGLKL